jgi:predicted RNA polymerase sigma factor
MDKLCNSSVIVGRRSSTLVLSMLLLLYVAPVFAYLDPGTGSIILQGVVASIAAALAAGGVFWHRIKAFFASLFSSADSTVVESDAEQSE